MSLYHFLYLSYHDKRSKVGEVTLLRWQHPWGSQEWGREGRASGPWGGLCEGGGLLEEEVPWGELRLCGWVDKWKWGQDSVVISLGKYWSSFLLCWLVPCKNPEEILATEENSDQEWVFQALPASSHTWPTESEANSLQDISTAKEVWKDSRCFSK